LANVRWELVAALMVACFAGLVVGLVLWLWPLWLIGLLGLLLIVGDIAWTLIAFARAKRAGESKLKF
jgi:Flp pilus assembly protein TadB